MTIFDGDKFIKAKLHDMFVEFGEKVANEVADDPGLLASIPIQMFRAEEFMRLSWDDFLLQVQRIEQVRAG
jgi:hypothetical protein